MSSNISMLSKMTKFIFPQKNSLVESKNELNEQLYLAVYTSNLKQLTEYLDKGANPNYSPYNDNAPLHIAAERDETTILYKLLKCKNINIDIKSDHGYTPIMLTCFFRKRKALMMLLKFGANPNISDFWNRTALLISTRREAFDLVYLLLQYNCDINALDCFENTALSTCLIDVPNIIIAEFLLRNGASFDNRQSQMHIFFELVLNTHNRNYIRLILLLLDWGININLVEPITGRNCLHFVALTGYLDLAKILVKKGANLDVIDISGRTPALIAKDHHHFMVHKFFEDRQRKAHKIRRKH